MGIGVAVFLDDQYQEELSRAIHFEDPSGSNNIAEWYAAREAMRIGVDLYKDGYTCEVYSDSQIIVNQFNGIFMIRDSKFLSYFNTAKLLANQANILKMQWIPREENTEADRLSKIGLHGEDYKANKKAHNRHRAVSNS